MSDTQQLGLAFSAPQRRIYPVRELVAAVRTQVERGFTDVYVEGVYQHASGQLGDGSANVAMINTLAPSSTGNQVAATVGLRHRF